MTDKINVTLKTIMKIVIAAAFLGAVIATVVILVNNNAKVNDVFNNALDKCKDVSNKVKTRYFTCYNKDNNESRPPV